MPKVKWGFDTSAEPAELGSFDDYDGPVPPTGIYITRLKRLVLKTNKNGDDMMNGLLVIAEPAGSEKAKFNGYAIWFNSNLTPQGLPYFKPFITNGLGCTWADFTGRTITESDERPTKVLKVGNVKVDGAEIVMKVQATYASSEQYGEKLENPRFLPNAPVAAPEKWADEDEDGGDDVVEGEIVEDDDGEGDPF